MRSYVYASLEDRDGVLSAVFTGEPPSANGREWEATSCAHARKHNAAGSLRISVPSPFSKSAAEGRPRTRQRGPVSLCDQQLARGYAAGS